MVKCAAVTRSQTKAFWSIFGGFCVGMTYSPGYLGVAVQINYIVKGLRFTAEE